VSVLTTVVGVYPERGSALCDAGSRALGKDALELPSNSPWGIVVGAENVRRKGWLFCSFCVRFFAKVDLVSISQEVGILKGAGVASLKVGHTLRIVPNHSCLTATNFEQYHVVSNELVVDVYTPAPRGFN
jgi:D-serine deaminase-like pyridoxal phosphate-dependent protein